MKIKAENVEIAIGKIKRDDWEEEKGPTPAPKVSDLRDWDRILLSRYKPKYFETCDKCCLCAMGVCDLSNGKKGACGMDSDTQQSRFSLLLAVIGTSTHASHARHMLDTIIEKFGRNLPIDIGENIEVEAPLFRLIMGEKPSTIGDLTEGLDYVEEEITSLLASTHMGQESDAIDFNSKILHAGMLDSLAMEIADIAQISALDFPKGDPDSPLVEIGFGSADLSKPLVLCIGHNVAGGMEIIDYAKENKEDIEVAGMCCTAHDITRYDKKSKVIGPLSYQLPFVRAGIADVIVLDEQCIRVDTIRNSEQLGIPMITTSERNCGGLPDLSDKSSDIIVKKLVSGEIPGVYLTDLEKVGEVAVKTALKIHQKKSKEKPEEEDLIKEIDKCRGGRGDEHCSNACLVGIKVNEVLQAIKEGKKKEAMDAIRKCVFCGRCESHCPMGVPTTRIFSKVLREELKDQKTKLRAGRGPIQDVEIRNVGRPIVFGEIPGVIAFAGCPIYPNGGEELAEMADEFLKRRYIVTTSGCSAMTLALDGKQSLYEKYPGNFDAACLSNVGSCVSNSHIVGAAVKIASIFAKRNLRANYEEIADYILNRVGAVAIVWGTMSQKALAIASGANRLGIPVILGPQGRKYRRELLSNWGTDWSAYDTRGEGKYDVGPAPEHLFYAADTKEEAMILAAKLCMRASDGAKGRQMKLAHWIDLHKKIHGKLPEDLHKFVRNETDLPITQKEELLNVLKERGWKPVEKIPDPTLVERLSGGKKKND